MEHPRQKMWNIGERKYEKSKIGNMEHQRENIEHQIENMEYPRQKIQNIRDRKYGPSERENMEHQTENNKHQIKKYIRNQGSGLGFHAGRTQ